MITIKHDVSIVYIYTYIRTLYDVHTIFDKNNGIGKFYIVPNNMSGLSHK